MPSLVWILVTVVMANVATADSPPKCNHSNKLASDHPAGSWRQRLASGKPVTAVLTYMDTDAFLGAKDPLGTLLGGTEYTVLHDKGAFAVTGFSESTQGVGTWTYRNADLAQNTISLWGVVARFDPKTGALYERTHGKIGYLK